MYRNQNDGSQLAGYGNGGRAKLPENRIDLLKESLQFREIGYLDFQSIGLAREG